MSVINASDIQILLPIGDDEALEPIVHIYNASLSISSSLKAIIKFDDADSIWDNDIVDGLSWQLSGSSYVVIFPGNSFKKILGLQVDRDPVTVKFRIGSEHYKGAVIVRRLNITGNTEQSAQMSFDFKGQGVFEEDV